MASQCAGGNGVDWKPVTRGDGDTVSHLPLSALVSQAIVAFAMKYEEQSPVALSLSTGMISRIADEGQPLREIGRSAAVSALIRHGFMHVNCRDGIETKFLTPRGLKVKRIYWQRIHGVEARWREKLGDDLISTLRNAIVVRR
jgi:hypothetical protein